jgi:hypothetical protein
MTPKATVADTKCFRTEETRDLRLLVSVQAAPPALPFMAPVK